MRRGFYKRIGLVLALGLYSQVLLAQLTAKQVAKEMERGINLGNTFDAPNYEGEWGTAAKEYYFDMYADAGFNTVRIPITWNKRIGTADPYTIDASFLTRIDEVIGWSLDRGLYTIINAHHDEWIKNAATFNAQKARFYALWEQIAEHYKNYSDKLIFEIVNEPHHNDGSLTTQQLNELNKECHTIIRANNPTRIVIYGGPEWSNSPDLFKAAIPDSTDEYLMGYYHSYNPWSFAGEGQGTWGRWSQKQAMINQMVEAQNWSGKNNIPVLIGEFGAVHDCDFNSRMLYYATYAEHAVAHNLPFAVWDDDGWFQILERKNGTWNELKDILIYSTDSTITSLETKLVDDTVIELSWETRSNADLVQKLLVERRTASSGFEVVAEFNIDTSNIVSSYLDYNTEAEVYYYYRLAEVYATDTIPTYEVREKSIEPVVSNPMTEASGKELVLYPNPANDEIKVVLEGSEIEHLNIYNINGEEVKREKVEAGSKVIVLESFDSGIYFVVAKTQKGILKTSFIKE